MPYTEIDEIFETAAYWFIDDVGHIVSESVSKLKRKPTDEELARDHPQLASAMRQLIGLDLSASSGNGTAPAAQAYFTRFLLHKPAVSIRDDTGLTWTFALLSRLFQPQDPAVMRLTGATVDFVMKNTDGSDVKLVTDVKWVDQDVSKELLESQYPGWSDRAVVAEQLAMEPDDLLSYVFPPASSLAPIITLDGVTYS